MWGFSLLPVQNNRLQGKQASILSPSIAYAKGTRKEWRPIYSRMEEHVVVYRDVSAAKGKSKVKRPRQLEDTEDGDKLEHLRSELDSLTSLLSLEESEEPDENLSAELDRLPSPRQLEDGDNLEHLRSELDSLTSRLPLKKSEEPEENLCAELERLLPPEPQEPIELEELVVDKTLTPSPWTTLMDYPNGLP